MTQARLLAFIVVAALTTALWSPGRAVAADAGSQRGIVRERAAGTWSGEFGALEFHTSPTLGA